MNNHQKLALNVLVVTILLAIFGIIFNKNPFEALSTYLMLLGVVLIASTVVTLPFYSGEYSVNIFSFSISILILAVIAQMIWPAPEPPTYTEDQMGNHPQAQWQFELFYKEYGLRQSTIFSFTGTTEESEIALKGTIAKWNREHPSLPIVDCYRSLTYIPKNYAKLHGYDPMFAGEF